MVRKSSTRSGSLICLGLGLAALLITFGACGTNSGTTPSGSSTVTSFITGAIASDGTTAVSQSGAAPVPSGGPSITVTGPGTVVVGASAVVRIQSNLPFTTVFAFVDGVNGFLKLSLAAPTTDTTLVESLSSSIPNTMFTADYRVAAQNGAVGVSATVPSVASPNVGASANVTGTWALQGTPIVSLAQSGANVTGNEIFGPLGSIQGVSVTATGVVSGTVAGSVFTGTNKVQVSASGSGVNIQCSETDGFVLQISGSSMTGPYTSGTLTCNVPGPPSPGQLPFIITLTKQ